MDVEAIVAVFLHPATEGVEVRRLAVQRVGNIVVVAAERSMKRPRLLLFFDSPINSLSLGDGESLQMVRGPQVRTLVGTRKRREGLSPFCHPRWLPAAPLMLLRYSSPSLDRALLRAWLVGITSFLR